MCATPGPGLESGHRLLWGDLVVADHLRREYGRDTDIGGLGQYLFRVSLGSPQI